jgi:hypothetical protein
MNSGQSTLSGRRLWVWPSTARWCSSGAAPALFSVRPDGCGMPASTVFTAFHAYGGGTGGWPTAAGPGLPRTSRSTPTTVMRAGRLPGRLAAELVRGMLPRPGLTIAMTVWTNTTNRLRWMEASTPSSQKYGPADQPLQIWALHDVGSAAPKLATRGGPNRAIREPRPRRATCTDAGALTPRSVFVDDGEAACRRPGKAISGDLIPVGRTDATEGPRATVGYALPS